MLQAEINLFASSPFSLIFLELRSMCQNICILYKSCATPCSVLTDPGECSSPLRFEHLNINKITESILLWLDKPYQPSWPQSSPSL